MAAAFCLLVAASCPAARAEQPPPDPDLSTEGTRRMGPFRVRPFLQIKDAGYDDNIYLDSVRPVGDWTATAAPGIRMLLLAGDRGGLLLSPEIAYVAFLENSELDHLNGLARAKGMLLLRRLEVWLEDSYASVEARPAAGIGGERPNAEIDSRLRRRSNNVTAGARSLGEGRFRWSGYARRGRIGYSPGATRAGEGSRSGGEAVGGPGAEEASRNLDRRQDTLSVTGEVKALPKTSLTLEGRLEDASFAGSARGRDSRIAALLPGLRFDPSASLQGEMRFGVARLGSPDRAGAPGYRCAVGEGRLSAKIGGFGRAKGLFTRGLEFSASDEYHYYVSSAWSAGYEQFFSRYLSAEFLYGRGINVYPAESAAASALPRRDRFTTWEAAVRYRLGTGLALTALARRFVREASEDRSGLHRTLYAIGTTIDF